MQEPPLRFRRRFFSSAMTTGRAPDADGREMVFVRYSGYMNNSGLILPSLLRRYGASVEDLLVVVDNMDLPPGSVRLRRGGGTAGHNGLKSIVACLGETGFTRLYVGVGRPEKGVSVVDHVLGVPSREDTAAIGDACRRGAEAVIRLGTDSFDRVAEELNRRGT